MQMTDKEKEMLKGLRIGTEREMVANRFSGEQVELCPEAVALYDLIMGCEISLHQGSDCADLFYTGINVFRRNWPDEYYILLD